MRAAEQLKRVNLELGGIDPLIVFEDADLDVAVPGAAWARFLNNGQVCTSAKRIYVVEAIAHGVHRAIRRAHRDRCASGTAWIRTTDLGPLISERARARVEEQVQRARSRRARGVLEGGRRLDVGPGWFYAPTVLTDVQPRHAVVVRGGVRADRVDPGRSRTPTKRSPLAAQSEYGLGANIYTQQPDLGACARCRRSRRAPSGSTIR